MDSYDPTKGIPPPLSPPCIISPDQQEPCDIRTQVSKSPEEQWLQTAVLLLRRSQRLPMTMTQALPHYPPVESKRVVKADIVLFSHITGGQSLQRFHQLNDG